MAGLATSFGSGAMTNSIGEIPYSKTLFIIGANPSEAHPVIGAKMRQALKRGAQLIVADPRKTELAAKADVWLRLKPGTDIALINGIMHIILKSGWHDQEFINSNTTGFEEVAKIVERYTPAYVENITGVPQYKLREAARIYGTSERAQIFYTLGITEHTCGTDNVMSLANLAMMTGNIGKPNAGVNPIRGQNNVQGACDMGALPNVYPGYQKVADQAVRAKYEKAWGVKLPDKPGMTIPDMFDEAQKGNLKAMYIMGEDPVLTDANANHVQAALEKLDFLVVQNIFMSETAKLADVVLPASSFAEKDGTFTNTERRVQRVRRAISPIGQSRPDWQIIMDLSNRMGYSMSYNHPGEIMAEVAENSPIYAGISYERIETKGLQWPVPHKEHPGTVFLHENGKFTQGKGVFKAINHQPPAETPDDEYPLLLSTGRILYHYNITTAGYSKHLTKYRSQEEVMINPEDAKTLNINNQERILVSSRRGKVEAAAFITDIVPPGVVWMSFHYPESPTNKLTSDYSDKVTKTYEYKVCAVKVEKAASLAK